MTTVHSAKCTTVSEERSPACQAERRFLYDDAESGTLPNAPSAAACRFAK